MGHVPPCAIAHTRPDEGTVITSALTVYSYTLHTRLTLSFLGPSNVPVDTPVFSSPLVHVVMPGGRGSGGGDGSTGFVHVDGRGSILPGTVHKQEIETTKDPFPLGVKLAMRGDSGISVTNAQMYRPWFFNLEDLAAMVRAAIKKEASLRVAKNKTQRDVTRYVLYLPNPNTVFPIETDTFRSQSQESPRRDAHRDYAHETEQEIVRVRHARDRGSEREFGW